MKYAICKYVLGPRFFGIFFSTLAGSAFIPTHLGATGLNLDRPCTAESQYYPNITFNCYGTIKKTWYSKDLIIVPEDKIYNVSVTDSNKTVTAIKGSYRDSTIINLGEVNLQVTNTGFTIPPWRHGYSPSVHQDKTSYAGKHYPFPYWNKHYPGKNHGHEKTDSEYWLLNWESFPLHAVGIAGGSGNDVIINKGLLSLSANSILTDETGVAGIHAIGIQGDRGNDLLINKGELSVTSNAEVTNNDVTISLIDSGDAQRKALAAAIAVTGNKGNDYIVNKGQIDVNANATVNTSDFSVSLAGEPVDVDAASKAWAGAIGFDGGHGNDHLFNLGSMEVSADAEVISSQVSIDLISLPSGRGVRAPIDVNAMAIGIAGGDGDDWIYNSGDLNIVAEADAKALDVQITGLSLTENGANTISKATALGIHAGAGNDKVQNDGNITVDATAVTQIDSFDVSVFDLSFVPPLLGFENEQVVTKAASAAIGIAAGEGNDAVENSGSLVVQSNATVDIDSLSIDLLGLESDVNRTAFAKSAGITGDSGNDLIKNSGQLEATSTARLDLLGISVDLLGGATDIEGSNQSFAKVTGIDGGDGNDLIFNFGNTTATANASVNSVDVGISLLSALQGSDVRAPVHAGAFANGLSGGDGHDLIKSTGTLTVSADARADALDMEFSAVDISSGAMSTTSESSASGIDGGKESSVIFNSGETTVSSSATTDTESFSFTLVDLSIVSDIVDLIFNTPVDTSTTSKADASGITTGANNDHIVNNGSLSVDVDAITNSFEMSMSADGVSNFTELSAFPDFFLEAPVIDASTTATATVTGINSGAGNDDVDNSGTLATNATADVSATSIGVDLPLPNLLPQLLPNIDTTEVATAASAMSSGINTGDGYDSVKNEGSVKSEAISNANSLSVNATLDVPLIPDPIDFNIPYSIEANLVDVGAQSESFAMGIETGKSGDTLYSAGDVTANASTSATATNIAATVAYSDDKVGFELSLANATTEGKSTAVAIDSGEGNDSLHTKGTVVADAFTDTNSTAVTVKLQAVKDTIVGIGASASRANTEAETGSFGVLLGDGNDHIYNEASITAKAHNNADAVGVDVAVTIPAGDNFGIIGEGNWVTTDTIATSLASGIVGGDGKDIIFNSGMISADALSKPNSVGVAANASGTKKGASIGIALTQAKTDGTATSNGISGGEDKDLLVNTGTIDSKARTETVAVSVAASLALTDKGVALTGTAADGSTNATSTASGMSGDEGEDIIKNKGTVDVLADADAVTGSVSVSAQGASKGVALGLALSRATSEADAISLGIGGGSQNDVIFSEGLTRSKANADVIAGSLAIAGGGTAKGLTVEGAAADGSTTSKAGATGIDGGQGKDYIASQGAVEAMADVSATSVSVGVTANGTGTGVTIGIALARAKSEGEASSTGIEGGEDDDHILSSGTVKSHASSLVIAGSGALAAGGAGKGVSAQGVGVDAQTSSTSTAKGISGGDGKDKIIVEEAVDVFSNSSTTSIGVAVTANGTGTGLTFGLGLARAGADGEAIGHGVSGGNDDDFLFSNQQIKSHAKSLVIAGSGGLAAGGTGKGVTITGAAVDAATIGNAEARGLSGDSGRDIIVNKEMIDVLADADSTSVGLAVAANGTGAGVSLGIGLARATTQANADSIGISGGDDDDKIVNAGQIKSHAISDAIAGSAALAGTFAGKGVSLSGAAADASTVGNAQAFGINGGAGVDQIFNEGDMDVLADVDATSVSVGASASFTAAGVGLGVSLARTDTKANATATGISLGGEDDIADDMAGPLDEKYETTKSGKKDCHSTGKKHGYCDDPEPEEKIQTVVNSGEITSKAVADADSVSVSVQVGFTGAGVQAGGALADASTRATASSIGIEGSNRKDIIDNQNSIDATANADAATTSVAVNFNAGVKSLSLSAALTDATANGSASSIGIAGLGGDDKISNSASVSASSTADTNAVAVSVPISLSIVPLSAAFADADASAIADATAIHGGDGNDYLESYGVLMTDANSNADGISVSVAPIGVALVGANISAQANSVGMEGGTGDDVILQQEAGSLTANSNVTATGTTIGATVFGVVGNFDNTSTATSRSTGISGGTGKDITINKGDINTTASSEATGTSVSAALTGITFANTTTIANTFSTGISGGEDQDLIFNQGNIQVTGSSKTLGTSVGASVDPVSFTDTSSTSVTRNSGISAGEGDDVIKNKGSIDVDGSSTATGTSVSVALRYAAFADASTSASTHNKGISGDAGSDYIFNENSVLAKSSANATGTSVSAGLAGATFADSNTNANSFSTGISSDAGLDKILNLGSVRAEANATATGTTVSATLAGASFADMASTAEANAIGIATGTEKDKLINKETISAIANATADGTSVAAGLLGFFDGDASTTVIANAMGIDLGAGDDTVFSEATIDLVANSNSKVTTGTGALAGVATAKVNTTSGVAATGIDGGIGNDLIINKGAITIGSGSAADPWMSSLTSTGFSLAIAGVAIAESSLFAKTESSGVAGGAGNDRIYNAGDLDISATSRSSSSNTSIGIFGAAGSDATSGAITRATGIAGGDGNNEIENLNLIDVNSNTFASISGSSFTFAGGSSNDAALTAEGMVSGISAGKDDDLISNKGQIDIDTSANLTITGSSKVAFGVATIDSATSSELLATGIDSGAGNDMVSNEAELMVTSTATTSSNRTSYAFGGGSNVNAMLAANSRSKGIVSESGKTHVSNSGNITVNANSSLTATGGASSTIGFGGALSAASVAASSHVGGIETGGGHDELINMADITGTAQANSNSLTNANAGTFFSDGKTRSTATTNSSATGMSFGGGDNLISNEGNIVLQTTGRAFADADSDGDIIDNILGIDQDAFATSIASVSKSEATGLLGSNGKNQVENTGNLTVSVLTEAFTDSNADGDAIISGDGTATSTSRADNLKSFGIKLGDGDNWISNKGVVTVKTRPRVNAKSQSDADGVGTTQPDSRANAFAFANNALAVGIWAGDGDNEIINDGVLDIESAPNVDKADAFADFGGDVLGIDAFARATATANDAKSYGILVGDGNNSIWNLNEITVATRPRAVTRAFGNAVGFDGDASAWANSNANNALAVGIRTGNGDNMVVNKGEINVVAAPFAFADAIASPGSNFFNDGEVEAFEENATTANAQAIGIWTGSGDDTIFNKGSITVDASGSSPVEVAIRSGAGDDFVGLGEISTTTGAIDLGEDDDTLHIVNSPVVNGRINGGDGTDTAVYEGEGTFSTVLEPDFENTVKLGAGTYTLAGLPSMQSIAVEQGVLEINSDYELPVGGSIMPSVTSGDGKGRLVINGALSVSAGTIDVNKGRGHHIDGDRQTVLYASGGILDSMSFDNISVPQKTPLYEFHPQVTDQEIQISTSVKPFDTVAHTDNQLVIAGYLERLLSDAEGDISIVLGEIQALPAGGHDSAFSSLNPEAYVNSQQALEFSVKNHVSTLHQRTRGLRNVNRYSEFVQPGFVSLSTQGMNADPYYPADSIAGMLNLVQRKYQPRGSWLKSFRQDGELDSTANNNGFNFDSSGYSFGFDQWLDQRWILGVSLSNNTTDVTADGKRSRSDIDSQLLSFYTSYVTKAGYINGSITAGDNTYNSSREVSIGEINNTVLSDHDSRVLGVSVGGGFFLPAGSWDIETYAALNYQRQDSDGFKEEGSGGVSLDVSSRQSDLISSELGIRFAKQFTRRTGSLFTEYGLAWIHEIEEDGSIQVSFVDTPDSSFTVDAQDIDDDGVSVNAGLRYVGKAGLSGLAEYRTEIREDYSDQILSGSVQYQFD